MHCKDELL